jgi:biopolymer transport protein ExbD
MKRLIHSETPALGFQIAPMIDVVFVIMLFFMVMVGTVKVEREIITRLPSPGDPQVRFPVEEITIGILEDGTVTLNEESYDTPQDKALPVLTGTLLRLAESSARQKQPLLVTPRPRSRPATNASSRAELPAQGRDPKRDLHRRHAAALILEARHSNAARDDSLPLPPTFFAHVTLPAFPPGCIHCVRTARQPSARAALAAG